MATSSNTKRARRLYLESLRLSSFHIERLDEYSEDEKVWESMARMLREDGNTEFDFAVESLNQMSTVINRLRFSMQQAKALKIAARSRKRATSQPQNEFDARLIEEATGAFEKLLELLNSDDSGPEFDSRLLVARARWHVYSTELPEKARRLIAAVAIG